MNTSNLLESAKMHAEGLLPTLFDMLTSGGLDSYANFMGDCENHKDHFYLYSNSRDSRLLERSNFAVIENRLKELEANYTIERHGHWACGWIDHILLSFDNEPGTIREASEMVNALSEYPILSDDHYYSLENEEIVNLWGEDIAERIEYCKSAKVSIFAARDDNPPYRVYEYLSCDL